MVVDGYEDGYDDLSPEQLQTVEITLNQVLPCSEGSIHASTGKRVAKTTLDAGVDLLCRATLQSPGETISLATQRNPPFPKWMNGICG